MTQEERLQEQTPLPRYRVQQLHSQRLGNEPVDTLDGLVTHHPISNRNARLQEGVPVDVEDARARSYGVIGGEIQELETRRTNGNGAGLLGPDQVLLIKDFMLEDSRLPAGPQSRSVDVPAPVAGIIGTVNVRQGLVDILDGDGGEVIARIRHMDPIHVESGDLVEYGQAIGTQNNQATGAIHVHMEVDTRYYLQYENYVDDLHSGRLSIDPGRRTAGIEARPVMDDGVIRIGESADIVRRVQQHLNNEGFRGADDRLLQVDGVYRLSMQAAVITFQQARGLPQTGDIDPVTLQEIAPRIFPPALDREQPEGGLRPVLPPYFQHQGAVPGSDHLHPVIDDPLMLQAESAVRSLDRSMGREYDSHSACMAAGAACLAKTNGLSRIDHIVLSEGNGTARNGENLFVVQGALNDPANHWATMKTQDAVTTSVQKSMERLQALGAPPQLQPAAPMDNPEREVARQPRMA